MSNVLYPWQKFPGYLKLKHEGGKEMENVEYFRYECTENRNEITMKTVNAYLDEIIVETREGGTHVIDVKDLEKALHKVGYMLTIMPSANNRGRILEELK